jgi:hypothetical protein
MGFAFILAPPFIKAAYKASIWQKGHKKTSLGVLYKACPKRYNQGANTCFILFGKAATKIRFLLAQGAGFLFVRISTRNNRLKMILRL